MAGSTDYIKWLNRASQDIKMIESIKDDGLEGMEDSFCYLCHQAVEKLLKALVIKEEKSVQKTHDLGFLLGKCGKYHKQLSDFKDKITILNEYAVSARYPDDFGEKRTINDAEEAYNYVKEIDTVINSILIK
jgi:HEPN domain-containing protein